MRRPVGEFGRATHFLSSKFYHIRVKLQDKNKLEPSGFAQGNTKIVSGHPPPPFSAAKGSVQQFVS